MKPTNPPIMLPIHTVILRAFVDYIIYMMYSTQTDKAPDQTQTNFWFRFRFLNFHIIRSISRKKHPHNLLKRWWREVEERDVLEISIQFNSIQYSFHALNESIHSIRLISPQLTPMFQRTRWLIIRVNV